MPRGQGSLHAADMARAEVLPTGRAPKFKKSQCIPFLAKLQERDCALSGAVLRAKANCPIDVKDVA